MSVVIYSTATCGWCKKTKAFFEANNITFTDYNVGEDEKKAEEMFAKSGQMGVPVIDIDGNIVVGYDEARLKSLLSL
jgi:glutaredoxin-like YruB-family protein